MGDLQRPNHRGFQNQSTIVSPFRYADPFSQPLSNTLHGRICLLSPARMVCIKKWLQKKENDQISWHIKPFKTAFFTETGLPESG